MAFEPRPAYLTIEQAAAYVGVTPGAIRRLLRQYGMGEFVRASISKQVLIRRADLDTLELHTGGLRSAGESRSRRGAA